MKFENLRAPGPRPSAPLNATPAEAPPFAAPSPEAPSFEAPSFEAPPFEAARIPGIMGSTVPREPAGGSLVDHMLANNDRYDQRIAAALCAVAAWTYSEPDTFARMMARRGFPGANCVSISFANDALFVDTNAMLLQSADGKLAIISFRGTQPTNTINWLANASIRTDTFHQVGRVHGGFYRTVLALLPEISGMLKNIIAGESICNVAAHTEAETKCDHGGAPIKPDALPASTERGLHKLYITGHSLGGALAVLTAALFHADSGYAPLAKMLGGVYTFGQPMVGDAMFAESCQQDFGPKLFRHVYEHDIVPRLPPRSTGVFKHFGEEYMSTEEGWLKRSQIASQTLTALISTAIGGLAWVLQQIPFFSQVRLPYSWADHSPLNYLRTSLATRPGTELE